MTDLPSDRDDRPAGTRSIEALTEDFRSRDYITDRSLATAVFLALELGRPLLLEGEAGVGKTELAKVLAASLGARLIRLQCYEGLDVNTAVYEWNYPRQMLEIRLLEARGQAEHASAHDIFGSDFLIRRPLLQALESDDGVAPVLLIDEIDRADEEFEAYLLEILSDFQVTVPEIGTIRAEKPPRVILTSNRTREVHDALKRRCLYHWIDYPTAQKEYEIVLARVPESPERLAREVVGFVHRLREADLTKVPGIAETLDWAAALLSLGARELRPDLVDETLGVVLKYEEDIRQVRGEQAARMLTEIAAARVLSPRQYLVRRPAAGTEALPTADDRPSRSRSDRRRSRSTATTASSSPSPTLGCSARQTASSPATPVSSRATTCGSTGNGRSFWRRGPSSSSRRGSSSRTRPRSMRMARSNANRSPCGSTGPWRMRSTRTSTSRTMHAGPCG